MRDDDDTWIEPSAGFSRRILAEVEREARAPRPIPFPWRRLASGAGAILVLAAIGSAAAAPIRQGAAEQIARAAGAIPTGELAAATVVVLVLGGLIGITARLASR